MYDNNFTGIQLINYKKDGQMLKKDENQEIWFT